MFYILYPSKDICIRVARETMRTKYFRDYRGILEIVRFFVNLTVEVFKNARISNEKALFRRLHDDSLLEL
jgi:hypothetical protein